MLCCGSLMWDGRCGLKFFIECFCLVMLIGLLFMYFVVWVLKELGVWVVIFMWCSILVILLCVLIWLWNYGRCCFMSCFMFFFMIIFLRCCFGWMRGLLSFIVFLSLMLMVMWCLVRCGLIICVCFSSVCCCFCGFCLKWVCSCVFIIRVRGVLFFMFSCGCLFIICFWVVKRDCLCCVSFFLSLLLMRFFF